MPKEKILVIDDELDKLFIFEMRLKNIGYEVITASEGLSGIEKAQETQPELILLDINMPDMDGHEICYELKTNFQTRHIPVVMLTSSDSLSDKVKGLKQGADDYILKNVDPLELEIRIDMLLRRFEESYHVNPLTNLPGNISVEKEITERINANQQFAACYLDLNNFKAYNDLYGFKQGDEVIKAAVNVIKNTLKQNGNPKDFAGHLGGDKFMFITTIDKIDDICTVIANDFDTIVPNFYNSDDKNRGFITTEDRQGNTQQFSFVTLSMVIISNDIRPLGSIGEIAAIAADLKTALRRKNLKHSAFIKNQRKIVE